MVFIDAGHSYEDVKQDIAMACDMRIPVISGHDYHALHVGVRQAVDEQFGQAKTVQGRVWLHSGPAGVAAVR